ncbi:MAG: hypothetical protein D6707_07855, partial [Bacteroidetes bacterium]
VDFVSLGIYNRWGIEVYSSKSSAVWEGTDKQDNAVPDGVYYYLMQVKSKSSQVLSTRKGFIHVFR